MGPTQVTINFISTQSLHKIVRTSICTNAVAIISCAAVFDFQRNFGHVDFPQNPVISPPAAKMIGEFAQRAHDVRSGDIFVQDTKTFHIKNLHYDGTGPGTVKQAADLVQHSWRLNLTSRWCELTYILFPRLRTHESIHFTQIIPRMRPANSRRRLLLTGHITRKIPDFI